MFECMSTCHSQSAHEKTNGFIHGESKGCDSRCGSKAMKVRAPGRSGDAEMIVVSVTASAFTNESILLSIMAFLPLVARSQTTTRRLSPAETNRCCPRCTARTHPMWVSVRAAIHSPDTTFQSRTSDRESPLAAIAPVPILAAWTSTQYTSPACPTSVCTSNPDSADHNRTVRSDPPETACTPESAKHVTSSVWPRSSSTTAGPGPLGSGGDPRQALMSVSYDVEKNEMRPGAIATWSDRTSSRWARSTAMSSPFRRDHTMMPPRPPPVTASWGHRQQHSTLPSTAWPAAVHTGAKFVALWSWTAPVAIPTSNESSQRATQLTDAPSERCSVASPVAMSHRTNVSPPPLTATSPAAVTTKHSTGRRRLCSLPRGSNVYPDGVSQARSIFARRWCSSRQVASDRTRCDPHPCTHSACHASSSS
eukprot:m.238675 g.238675  ORF g.238675 m.238675 type:complete len:422 (+) comp26238_c0_seq4:3107-4372(+)